MKPASQVTALVVSNGLDVSLAAKLAETYKRVFFHVPRDDEFPRINDGMIGVGMGNIEVIESPWGNAYEETDLWVFPDLGFGDMQLFLESQGKIVWGSRRGEEMEQDRVAMKKHLESLGLPVVPWVSVKGFTALREYLQKNKEVYVKVSKWRGSWETLFSDDYELVKPELDEREMKLSGVAEQIEFIVEQKLDEAVEIATDGWCIDGDFPSKTLVGIEQKDAAYVGKVMLREEAPAPLQLLEKKLSETMRNYGYRNFWSPESLISDGKAYLNDPCCRIPEPPGALYLELVENLAEIIWAGANGEIIEPEYIAPIGVQLVLRSEWSDNHWNTLQWPKKYDRNVKLREACFVGGKYHSIPQSIGLNSPGSVVAWGNTLDEAEAQAIEIAQSIKATHLKVPLDAFGKLREALAKLQQALAEAQSYGLKI